MQWSNLSNLPDTLEELTVKYITYPNYWNVPICNITNLIHGLENINITNLPFGLKKIFTLGTNFKYFTKIPFGCELHEI